MNSTMRKVIVNTTPIIALADIGQLDLLQKLYGEITIPKAVEDEILSEPAKTAVKSCKWIRICNISDDSQKKFFRSRLHAGEVEVMILADELKADLVIMDDNAAKKTAKFMGLEVTGTFGVLTKAKRKGFIDQVKPFMDALIEDGLYINETLRQVILEMAEEA